MISLELSSIQHNRVESARLAQAMAEYESRGGNITQGACFTGKPSPPKRRDWIDPETVLVRKRRRLRPTEAETVRRMTEAI